MGDHPPKCCKPNKCLLELFCLTVVLGSAKSDTNDFVSTLNGFDIKTREDTDDLSHNFILALVRKIASNLNANGSEQPHDEKGRRKRRSKSEIGKTTKKQKTTAKAGEATLAKKPTKQKKKKKQRAKSQKEKKGAKCAANENKRISAKSSQLEKNKNTLMIKNSKKDSKVKDQVQIAVRKAKAKNANSDKRWLRR